LSGFRAALVAASAVAGPEAAGLSEDALGEPTSRALAGPTPAEQGAAPTPVTATSPAQQTHAANVLIQLLLDPEMLIS
jgi:hypothetical protein